MYRKYLVTAAAIVAFTIPAFAASTYYVEQSVKTQKCYVTTKKPNGTTMTMIGTSTYPTKASARAAEKADPACQPPKKA